MNEKIIINVDTGLDDALALIMSYKLFENRVIGITTSAGNVSLDKVNINTNYIKSLCNWNIKIYSGSYKNIDNKDYDYAPYFHGDNGLANIKIPNTINKETEKESAEDFIISMSKRYSGNISIINLAPCTNIAKAFKKDSTITEDINSIIIMGGAVNVPGNETLYSEFNFYQDPKAAQTIIRNFKNIKLVPLDVTGKCFLEIEDLVGLKINVFSSFLKEIVTNWYSFFGNKKQRKFELYDPLAISAKDENFLVFEEKNVDIDTNKQIGRIIDGDYNIKYANEVDAIAFKKYFLNKFN